MSSLLNKTKKAIVQLNPAIKDVEGPIDHICYERISIIANKSNKWEYHVGTTIFFLFKANFHYGSGIAACNRCCYSNN